MTRALESAGVSHALIGGVAVGVHSGVPRATLDTNIAVVSTADRPGLERVLLQAGFARTGVFAHSVNFRHASSEPVQLAFDPMFDEMIERAERIVVSGTAIPIVRKDDLIAMKERAAADPERRNSKRLRDRADVALLKGNVDRVTLGQVTACSSHIERQMSIQYQHRLSRPPPSIPDLRKLSRYPHRLLLRRCREHRSFRHHM